MNHKLVNLSSKTLNAIETKHAGVGLYVRIALYTGLRYSSVSNIKYSDVIKQGNSYFLMIRKMKKQKDTQQVRINKDIYNRILKHKKTSKYNNYVIEGKSNVSPLTIQYVNQVLKYYLDTTSHKLRHTFAVVNKLNGTEIDLISVCLFHKNIATTMIYTTMALNIIRLHGKRAVSEYIMQMKKFVCILEE